MKHKRTITQAAGRKSLFRAYDEAFTQLSAEDRCGWLDLLRKYLEEQRIDDTARKLLEGLDF
jgi:hypothetical protein